VRHGGATYLFAVGMRNGRTNATFTVQGLAGPVREPREKFSNGAGEKNVEVLGENRTILSNNGVFKDKFEPWDVHLYRITESNAD